jgi:hypothetical protein
MNEERTGKCFRQVEHIRIVVCRLIHTTSIEFYDGHLEGLIQNCRGILTKQLFNVVSMRNSVSRAYLMKMTSENAS